MKIIPRESLVIRDRQRKKITAAQLNELRESIHSRGLINPPLVFPLADGKYLLIAGERRTRAIDLLAKDNLAFSCNGMIVAPGEFPMLITDLSTPLEHQELELDENIQRVDLTWQERCEALAAIHAMKKEANPRQTFVATAEPMVGEGKQFASIETGRRAVAEAVLIAEHLNNPTVSGARNATEAVALIWKTEEEKARAILARRRIAAMPSKPDVEVRKGDLLTLLPTLDAGQFDLLVADPPYGIDAGSGGFRARTVHHHNYEDSVDYAREVAQAILTDGFRLAKPSANLFLFTDIKHWDWLQRISAQIGWKPFRRPLIWGKSDSEGLAPWGSAGPRITTEFIFFATKGEKGLLASPTDYLRVNRVPRHERIHAAEKPVELIRRLIECSTLPGDRVLDPCCGSGSTLVAAKETQRRALGIEMDDTYYNTALSNLYKDAYTAANGEELPLGSPGTTIVNDGRPV